MVHLRGSSPGHVPLCGLVEVSTSRPVSSGVSSPAMVGFVARLSIEVPGVRLAHPFSGGGVSERLSCTAIEYTMHGWCIWVARPNYD